jgi:signal transduction histidine kinase
LSDDDAPVEAVVPAVIDAGERPWAVLIADDDEGVHSITRVVLDGIQFKDRPLELLSAYSAAEAKQILLSRPDIAVLLLDVVMERDDAGLALAREIRESIKNHTVRIILRTGQPGQAPEREVILNYDVNDYKSKAELTAQSLISATISAIRGFSDITALEQAHRKMMAVERALADRLEQVVAERTVELREALDYQTATAELLEVINSSPGRLAPVYDAMLERLLRLCEAAFGTISAWKGGRFHEIATCNRPAILGELAHRGHRPRCDSALSRLVAGERYVHVADAAEDPSYPKGSRSRRVLVDLAGARTYIAVPLRKGDELLGAFTIYRQQIRPFTEKQVELMESFGVQAVIAMENARLMTETHKARDIAEATLSELKTAQASLIHAEKMASLGQLTAGIAHEIKNPLNFVNNFAGLSVELLGELKVTTAPAITALEDEKRAEIDETFDMLTDNLEKIAGHGRRADNIVKSMLEHTRGSSGDRRSVDLNGLIEEALNFAYHRGRARDQSFNITLERDFGDPIAPIELFPQDITRVCLNLFGNGFYATTKRQKQASDPTFKPTLKVSTRDLGDAVQVQVRDNGIGIAPEIKDKLFQPFFTTKPTGEGTGLGLSIAYDIVTQRHGGTITVDSEVGEFTEFTVRLPRAYRATMAEAAS